MGRQRMKTGNNGIRVITEEGRGSEECREPQLQHKGSRRHEKSYELRLLG